MSTEQPIVTPQNNAMKSAIKAGIPGMRFSTPAPFPNFQMAEGKQPGALANPFARNDSKAKATNIVGGGPPVMAGNPVLNPAGPMLPKPSPKPPSQVGRGSQVGKPKVWEQELRPVDSASQVSHKSRNPQKLARGPDDPPQPSATPRVPAQHPSAPPLHQTNGNRELARPANAENNLLATSANARQSGFAVSPEVIPWHQLKPGLWEFQWIERDGNGHERETKVTYDSRKSSHSNTRREKAEIEIPSPFRAAKLLTMGSEGREEKPRLAIRPSKTSDPFQGAFVRRRKR